MFRHSGRQHNRNAVLCLWTMLCVCLGSCLRLVCAALCSAEYPHWGECVNFVHFTWNRKCLVGRIKVGMVDDGGSGVNEWRWWYCWTMRAYTSSERTRPNTLGIFYAEYRHHTAHTREREKVAYEKRAKTFCSMRQKLPQTAATAARLRVKMYTTCIMCRSVCAARKRSEGGGRST